MEDWLTNINEELLYKNRLKYLIENEEIYKLKFSNETEFTPEIRTNCILFMSSICIKKKCDKILHISIYLLDLFINKNLICKKKFKLVAITSIFFAGLLYRYKKIGNNFLLAQTDYTIEEFTEFKYYYSNHIINNLKNIIISYDYTRLVDQTPFWIKTKETDYILIRFLLEIYLTYSENISVKPSLLIESILFYILRYFEGKNLSLNLDSLLGIDIDKKKFSRLNIFKELSDILIKNIKKINNHEKYNFDLISGKVKLK